jgi:hypothetical protein
MRTTSIPFPFVLIFLLNLPVAALFAQIPVGNLSLNGPSTICLGDSTAFRVSVTNGGNPPFSITYSLNGVTQPSINTNNNPYDFQLALTQNTLVALTDLDANGQHCILTGGANISVVTPPTAVISGGGQICQGGSGTTIRVTFTGSGPYTFNYTADNVPEPPVTTNDNPYIINVNPSSGTIYRLTSVSNPTCAGTVSGTAIVFVFTPSTARLTGDSTFCNSAMTTLPVDFTGTGPFNLVYSINGVPQDTVETFDDPFLIPVDVDSTTEYRLLSVQSPGCFGSVIGSATVTVLYSPSYSNVQVQCDQAAGNYTVEFDVVNATPPLTLVSGVGAFNGNRFTSAPIPLAQDYAFVFRDSVNCGDVTVSGQTICNCNSEPGVMNSALGYACPGDSVIANFTDVVLNGSDSLRFILHTQPGIPLGDIIAWSDTPGFMISDTLPLDSVYYISTAVGPVLNGDTLDINSPCFRVATGTPLALRARPTATLAGDTTVCAGADLSVPVQLTGNAPFLLTYSFDNQAPDTVGPISTNPYNLNIGPASPGALRLISVKNLFCSNDLADTLQIANHPLPQITDLEVQCDFSNATYRVSFDAAGGTAPYAVNGVGGGFVGATFTSAPISNALPYAIALSDVNNCGQATASGTAICICPTFAGTMATTLIKRCPGETAVATPGGDQTLDTGDVLLFALHTLPGAGLGTVLAVSTSPSFNFLPGQMQFGVTYYISAVACNDLGNGQIDLNDPCLSVSAGTPVRWNAAPTATIGGTYNVCPGQQQLLGIQFTGQGPYLFTYTQNGSPTTAIAPQNNFAISTTLLQNTTIQLVSVSDANCPGTVSGQAVITVHPKPELSNLEIICNPDNLSYSVRFDVTAGDLATMTFTGNLTGTYNPVTGRYVSNNLPLVTPFTVIGRDIWNCGSDTLSGAENCSCTSAAGQITSNALDVCAGSPIVVPAATGSTFDVNDQLGYILYEAPLILPQAVIAASNQPDFGVVAGLQPGKTYFVAAVMGNPAATGGVNLGDPCLSISNSIPINVRALPTASIQGDTTVCIGSNYVFPVTFTGNAPYQLSYSINGGLPQPTVTAPQNTFLISVNNVQQTQVYTLNSIQDKYCPGQVSGTVTINVRQLPEIQLTGGGRICPGDSATLTINLLNASSCDVTINDGAAGFTLSGVTNGYTFKVSPSATTTYSLGAVTVFGNNCTLKSSGTATVDVRPLNIQITASNYNGFGISCNDATDGRLEVVSTGGFQPLSFQWSDSGTGLIRENLGAGAYAFTVTDAANCTATISATLTEPAPIQFSYRATDPTCTSNGKGAIVIQSVSNATGLVSVQIDQQTPTLLGALPQTLDGLPGGTYQITVEDDNGCTASENITLNPTGNIAVELGPELLLFQYDSVLLAPVITGGTPVRFQWTPTVGLADSLNLSTWAAPLRTTIYRLTVEDEDGCTATDIVTVKVDLTNRVYLPNVFKPDAPGINSTLTVFGGPEVALIRSMRVYDRWGGLMFERFDLKPNDPTAGWDGRWRGDDVAPGVYLYVVEVVYRNGETEVLSGDVTILR